ncbi:hypothetical protein [Arthrobacter sp. OY3WO11]|uniref:hypothetical protein n=1 Tax=Arthrobacter sp. OY3WO11 TaxID=1835723 RepID=UPI0007CFE8C9|nr:hypothetical protein [Arthrobacter sp. OY3WO11]OAE00642.1 hypothetical protein A6A22_03730 [Arthrobacter sp. OY3WO11]
MTPQAHHTADAVEEMLLDAGLGQDADLRRTLLAVGSLAQLPVPAPTGQLAALLAAGTCDAPGKDAQGSYTTEATPGDELGRRRRLRAHRPTVVGLALVAGMGMGVGTVAASSAGPAHTGSPSVQQLLEDWSPSWTIRTPQAAAPPPLQEGSDDAASGQDDGGLAGSGTTPGGEPPATAQPAEESGQGTTFLLPGQGWDEPGDVPAADGQDGRKEPEKNGHAAEEDTAAGPEQTGPTDPRTNNGNTPDKTGQRPVEAPGVPGNAGQGPAGQGADAAAGGKPVPGTKWLEKFVR